MSQGIAGPSSAVTIREQVARELAETWGAHRGGYGTAGPPMWADLPSEIQDSWREVAHTALARFQTAELSYVLGRLDGLMRVLTRGKGQHFIEQIIPGLHFDELLEEVSVTTELLWRALERMGVLQRAGR